MKLKGLQEHELLPMRANLIPHLCMSHAILPNPSLVDLAKAPPHDNCAQNTSYRTSLAGSRQRRRT